MANDFVLSANIPVQTWWYVHEQSNEDAVYLHSQNENNTPFPNQFSGVKWGGCNNQQLEKLIDHSRYKLGTLTNEYGVICVVSPNA